jgi:hypothetical protein
MRGFSFFVAATVALATGQISPAQNGLAISFNFSGGAGSEDPQPDIDTVDAGEITGVVPRGGWNNGSLNLGTRNNLINSDGTATPASITWSSDNTWGRNLVPSPINDLLSDYLDGATGFPVSVSLSFIPFSLYDVYVYTRRNDNSDNTNQGGSSNLLSDYTLNGTILQSVRTGDVRDTFVLATAGQIGNYIKFDDVTGSTLTLASNTNAANFQSPVDGIQIVEQIPEPGSAAVIAMGVVSALGLRRFRRA